MVEPMVRMRGLYKIFGARGKGVLHHVQGGMGKEELLARHGHVLGLNNINVDMQAGEITVVMGLSGSGKSTLIRHLNRLMLLSPNTCPCCASNSSLPMPSWTWSNMSLSRAPKIL